MTNNKWLKRFPGLVGLLFALTALSGGNAFSDEDKGGGNAMNLAPFARVAEIGPFVDPVEAYDMAKRVATEIGRYVATVDDTKEPTLFPANWVLGGLEGEVTPEKIEAAILRIPTPFPVDPEDAALGIKKVNVVELCNPLFAKKALGYEPIVDDVTITDGYIHAPSLPCEVAIYSDDEGYVNVEMLNPEAIFTLFFTDVLFGEQMQDEAFAAAIQELPAVVNNEIRTILLLALDTADPAIPYMAIDPPMPLGPVYKSLEQVAEVVEETPTESPFVHFAYRKKGKVDGDRAFTLADAKALAVAIIETLKLTGEEREPLNQQLNFTDWTSPREAPLPIPNNQVVEACSPTNAKLAMGLGMHHATALPCEIAVTVADLKGGPETETLLVSYLDPHFMFGALFSDALADLTQEELEAFEALPGMLLEDLQTVVAYSIKHGLDMRLTRPKQVFYDMLPESEKGKGKKDDDDD